MNKLTLIAVGLAVLVLGTGAVAAQSADAPVAVPNPEPPVEGPADGEQLNETNESSPAHDQTDTDHSESGMNEEAPAGEAERGPPTDMPGAVPDHVTQIHETIRTFLDGDLEGSLGDEIQDIVGQDGAGDSNQNQSQTGA